MMFIILKLRLLLVTFSFLLFFSGLSFHVSHAQVNTFDQTAEDYRRQGYNAHQNGNLQEALKNYTKALALGLESAVVYNDIGILYEQLNRNGQAEKLYQRAIGIDDGYLPSYMNLAYLYLKEGQRDLAIKYFRIRYDKGDPDDVWTQRAKDELLGLDPTFRDEMIQREAIRLQQELVQKSRREFHDQVYRSKQHHQAGQNAFAEGLYQKALLELETALELTPGHPGVLKDLKNVHKALVKQRLHNQYQKALQQVDQGGYTEALEFLEQDGLWVHADANNPDVRTVDESLLFQQQQQSIKIEQALDLYDQGLKAKDQYHLELALKRFNEALQLTPDNPTLIKERELCGILWLKKK
jgi:tetratricopeptide (TPR) repeat protein